MRAAVLLCWLQVGAGDLLVPWLGVGFTGQTVVWSTSNGAVNLLPRIRVKELLRERAWRSWER